MSKYGEPWGRDEYDALMDADGKPVVFAAITVSLSSSRGKAHETTERARLCVNACASLSDESLEADVIGKAREALSFAADALKRAAHVARVYEDEDWAMDADKGERIARDALALLSESSQ